MRRLNFAAAAGAIALLAARSAAANGRFPQSNQIVFSPTDPNLVVARTTYGILPSHDDGTSWRYLCDDVLGLPPNSVDDPEIGLTAGNALVAGVYDPHGPGLDVSTDLGCNWSCMGGALSGQDVHDVVVRPDAPHVVLALTSTLGTRDGALDNDSQVFQSTDDGATWAPLGAPIDPTVTVETIDVAKSDPKRIYVSAWRGYGAYKTVSLFVSTDAGAHWTEHPVAAYDNTTEDAIWIAAVDPTNADRVYLRTNAPRDGGRSRLFLSSDGGQSFAVATSFDLGRAQSSAALTGEFLGFALSADGSKVYAGSPDGGLFVANRADMNFKHVSDIRVHCLATRGNELWACSEQQNGFLIGVSTDDGKSFTTKLPSILALCGPIVCDPEPGGPLGCGADANASACGASYQTFCDTYAGQITPPCGTCPGADAGVEDPGLAARPSGSSSCGCSAVGGRGSIAGLAGLAALAAVAGRRRRATRRHGDARRGAPGGGKR